MRKLYYVSVYDQVIDFSLNKKSKDLKVWLYQYNQALLEGDNSLDCFFKELKEKTKHLNEKYPRAHKLEVTKTSFPAHRHWVFWVKNTAKMSDIITIHVNQVNNIFIYA